MAYNGNKNLLSVSEKVEFTPEQIAEYAKCMQDPIYFIKTYYSIVHIDYGLIPFKPYPYQEEIIQTSLDNRFVICKLPRQSGKTTVIAALMLWYVLFQENYNILILAHKQDQSHEIMDRIKLAYEHIPLFLQQPILEWNKGNIELGNGSKIKASSTSSSAGRGGSFNLVYLDEFAFVPANLQEEFFASVYPVISSGKTSKVLITSTPKGMNLFYKMWVDSEEGRNTYKRIDIHWSDTPGRDEAWKQETIRNTSEEQFRQEFETEFLGSSHTLISGSKLRTLTYATPVEFDEYIRVYEKPVPGRFYMCTVDTARGLGLDYSAFKIYDVTEVPYKTVMVFRNNSIAPYIYPDYIYKFAQLYNEAAVLIEINDLGQQVADILYRELEYTNVLSTAPLRNGNMTISGGFSSNSTLGIRTTKQTKRVGCVSLKTLIESDKLVINDYNTLYELQRFVSNEKDSYEAEEGSNDDLVMCDVIFAWAVQQPYIKDMVNHDVRLALIEDNAKAIEDQLTPFGIIYDHGEERRPNEEVVRTVDPFGNPVDDWRW